MGRAQVSVAVGKAALVFAGEIKIIDPLAFSKELAVLGIKIQRATVAMTNGDMASLSLDCRAEFM